MNISELLQHALKHHQESNLQEAANLYNEILQIQQDNFYALHYLGVLHSQTGNFDLSISYIEKALQNNPSDSHANYNLGIAYQGAKKFDESIQAYKKALEIDPHNADACVNLGIVLKSQGKLDEAEASFRKALGINPEHAAAYNNLGTVLKEKGDTDNAIACYQKVLQMHPSSPQVIANIATAFREQGKLDDAVSAYRKALTLSADAPDILFQLGTALMEQGRGEEAVSVFEKILALRPESLSSRIARCIARLRIIYDDQESINISRARYLSELLQIRDGISLGIQQDREEAAKTVGLIQPFYLPYQGLNDKEPQQIYGEIVCKIMSSQYPQFSKRPSPTFLPSGEPLRIGFVSGYFYNHSVWKIPVKGWIQHLDRNRFRTYGYYTWRKKDEETVFAREHFDSFTEDMYSLEALIEKIKKDSPHVLIYPEIGMDPLSLKLASLRLAPVQCVSWGHPTTSGLPTIDYFLSSDLMEPPDADDHYTEQLIRLPNLSAYYEPSDMMQADVSRSAFHVKPDSVVYHCCQSIYKYLPHYDEVFPRIARQVGNSKFVFSAYPRSQWLTEQFRKRISHAFKKFSLNADDFSVFLPFLDSLHYNALYSFADIFLDPIGWSGCNSALDAIAYNLPIITFPGKLMRSRDAFAIMTVMGIKETVAASLDEYVDLAVRLGRDSGLRKKITDRISQNKHRLYHEKTCITALEDFLVKAVKEKRGEG